MINYWKAQDNREVDFVVSEGKNIISLIQVCSDMSNLETKNRELKALFNALDYFKLKEGIIITNENNYKEEIIDKKVIKIIPIWKWLLE